jgi:cell division protein FtsN
MVSYAELTKNNISITETAPEVVAEFPVENENYYIIGGAFRDQNNALKLISMLQQKGYPAAVVDTTPGGLYVVSMKGFSTLDEATNQLNEIRKDGFPSSWILKKHRG